MKNKFLLILILINKIFFCSYIFAEEFKFESSQIEILEKGNLIKADGGVKVLSNNDIEINGEKANYNKQKSILTVTKNVVVNDYENNLRITADKIIYNKKKETILSFKINNQVSIDDKNNKIKNISDKIIFNKKNNILSFVGNNLTEIDEKYKIFSSELFYKINPNEIYSNKKIKLIDIIGNNYEMEKFFFEVSNDFIKAKKLTLNDTANNKMKFENVVVNLNKNEIVGNNINIDFDNSLFGNKKNEPRLKGNTVVLNDKETTIYKGVFTTCKRKEGKCPPWSFKAEEVRHKKKEQIIEYKKGWLEIYDTPIVYFPYFFHPDPTVKRQSGFLMPSFQSSKNHGQSIQIPYYKVVSENKDLTFTPRLFLDNNILIQSEYRQANKNSDFITDLSFNRDKNNTKTHFFSNLKSSSEKNNFEINLETVSSDNYLKIHKLNSPLIKNLSTLRSYIDFNRTDTDYSFNTSVEIYEDLTRGKSDRYEYIYPNYNFVKDLNNGKSENGNLDFISSGFQKNYDTNVFETLLVNDIKYTSNHFISLNGFKNNYSLLLRNVNTNGENSSEYENKSDTKLLSSFLFTSKYPLKKEGDNNTKYLTPLLSARYSPNKTKNIKNLDRRLNYGNILSFDRLGKKDMVEGGPSATIGLEYSIKDNQNQDYFDLDLATVFRNEKDEDLPIKTTMNNKMSDIVGNMNYIPSKYFNFQYEFSLDNSLDYSNYNFVKSTFNINNFVTSFEFLEEDNIIGNKSYLINKSTINFDDSKSLSFGTSKDLDKDITEYYNLIYEYKNDCLIAALEYDKEYYSNDQLKPEENIFLKIKIVPFGEISTPKIK